MKRHHVVSLALFVALVVTGAAGASGGARTQPKKQYRIAYIAEGLQYPYSAALAKGVQTQGKALGQKIVVFDGRGKAETQANLVQDAIAQKVDAVLISPWDTGLAPRWVKQLHAARIPVAAVHTQVGNASFAGIPEQAFQLIENEVLTGKYAAQLALRAVSGGGKVAIVDGAAGAAAVPERAKLFKSIMAQHGFKTVAEQPGDWVADKGEAACQNMLTAHPDLKLIYAESDDMAVGCANAVRSAGSKAVVIGVGGSKLGITAIKTGKIYGTVCYQPYTEGRQATKLMVNYLNGKKPPKHSMFYATPTITNANLSKCKPEW
ncbi:MAG TPA: sugar ABC transporter substrate-binding protein [Gaiellaceae bacterium]|nr:sugar ABC transporter substrate-binding protein [Gaiellaceae bacterium]